MYCPHCGKHNPDSGKYCQACGKNLVRTNVRSILDVESPLTETPDKDSPEQAAPNKAAPGKAAPSAKPPADAPVGGGELTPGVIVLDRYRIIAGGGSRETAHIYRAMDQFHDKEVVLRFLRPAVPDRAAMRTFGRDSAQAIRDIRTAMGVPHPNFVEIFDTGEWNGRPFVVLEHIKGPTLMSFINDRGRLPVPEAARLFAPACDAIALAHRRGIIHGNINPSNIHVTTRPAPDGKSTVLHLKIAELGMGKLATPDTGTDPFQAPERNDEGKAPDARSDIYSLGAIFYRLFSGDVPDPFMLKDEQPNLGGIPGVQPYLRDIEDLVWKTINQWDLRFARAEELARAIEALATKAPQGGVEPMAAVPAAGRSGAPRAPGAAPGKRLPIPAIAGGAAVLLILIIGAFVFSGSDPDEKGTGSSASIPALSREDEEKLRRQREQEFIRQQKIPKILSDADLLRVDGYHDKALAKVEEALALDPDHEKAKALKSTIEADKRLKARKAEDAARYKDWMAKAGTFAKAKEYQKAIEAYTSALTFIETEEARAGLEKARNDAAIEAMHNQARAEFKQAMDHGDGLFKGKRVDEAFINYQRAEAILQMTPEAFKPEDTKAVQERMARVNAALGASSGMSRIEQLVSQNKWVEAKPEIEAAYAANPQDPRVAKLKADLDVHVPPTLPPGMQFNGVNSKGFKEYRILQDESVMILIPAGRTPIGSTTGEADEKPIRRVHLNAFLMDKCEVTWAQYFRFCKATGRKAPLAPRGWNILDNHPIVNVNYHDAAAYASWAGKRLPTECEWERAARGNDTRQWPWGNSWDDKRANARSTHKMTVPAGQFPVGASPWGLLDMAGNVREWCTDWYKETAYNTSVTRNPKGPSQGTYRVVRGGSWFSFPESSRCSSRGKEDPGVRNAETGFRCARTFNP